MDQVEKEEYKSTNNTESFETLSKTLLAINRAYQEALDEKIDKLKSLLKLNIEQQNDILEKISTRNLNISTLSNSTNRNDHNKLDSELNKIKGNYFKDRFQSEPDNNVDTIKRNKLVFYDYMPQLKSEWTLEYRNKLKQAVLNDSIRIIKNPFINKIKYLEEKIHNINMKSIEDKPKELITARKMLRECNNDLKKVEDFPENKILEQVDSDKIDWFKIAKVDLSGNWTPIECSLVWVNVCNPKINQSKWTNTENNKLIELARKFREKNWEKIAILLNTNRSAFLCMKRYHEKTADKYSRRDWSEKESQLLLDQAEVYRQGIFIPYNYLCYLNGTRDRNSVYNQHLRIDPSLNHGRWTQAEDQAFEEGIQYYSTNNWQEVSEYIGSRTAFQCKERYESKYLNPDKYKYWTVEEDKKLLDLVDEYGGQWSKIAANEFPTRTDHSLLFRYNKLMNWRKQNQWFESQPQEIQEFILFLIKKRKLKNEQEVENEIVYTIKGDVVPCAPKFGTSTNFIATVIDKIYEKQDLVTEFIQKKQNGQLSLTLLAKIGIYTPILNSLIAKYKKLYSRQIEQETNESEGKFSKSNKKNKSSKKKKLENENACSSEQTILDSEKLIESKKTKLESKRIKRKYTKKKFQLNQENPEDSQSTSTNINHYIRKEKRHKNKNFVSQIDSSTNLSIPDELDKSKENEKKRDVGKLKINQILNFIEFKNTQFNSFKEAAKSKNILFIESSENTTSSDNQSNQETIINSSNKENKTRKRKRSTLLNEELKKSKQESKKKSKKEKLPESRKIIKPVEITETGGLLPENNIAEKSELIVNYEQIEDGKKIPCLAEYPNEFKYLYSLKKDKDPKFFQKFIIINYKGTLVAVKPFNGVIDNEYFNDLRLNAVEKALKKVSLLK